MLAITLYSILCFNRNFTSLKGAKLLRGNPRPTHAGTVTGALIINKPIPNFSPLAVICWHNPRTYRQSHTLTLVQWGGREGGGGIGYWGCWTLPLFRFCLQWKAFDLLYKMKYILCVVALLDVCNVTKHGRHLVFFQELEIR